MSDSILWGAMGALVLIAVFARGIRLMRERISPAVEAWQGHIMAAIIQDSGETGAHTAAHQSAAVVVRRADQPVEATLFVGDATQLPQAVRHQVFRPSFDQALTLNVPDEVFHDAVAQAKRGGYRFSLPHPVPVVITRNTRGQLDWQLA